jgi:arginase
MRLVDGAQAIRGDLPSASTVVVDVPLEAGDDQGSKVNRLSSLQAVRDAQATALSHLAGPVLTIGGDCGVELASVAHAAAAGDVALLWFDAHPDFHTPQSSPSGAFHGMVVRTLMGEGDPRLVPGTPLGADRVLLLGTRSFDDAEAAATAESGVVSLPVAGLTADSLLAAVEATGAASVYIHVDLDVLDPAEVAGIGFPEPFGLGVSELTALIRAVRERYPLAGAGITEFAPATVEQASDDMSTVLRIIGALTR